MERIFWLLRRADKKDGCPRVREEFGDDGDVDVYDEAIWAQNLGHTLQIFNVAI